MNDQDVKSCPHDMRNESMKHGFIYYNICILFLTPY